MMDWTAVALFLASQGASLIAKGAELWAATGKSPDEYEAAVDAALEARQALVDKQKAAELAALGGK